MMTMERQIFGLAWEGLTVDERRAVSDDLAAIVTDGEATGLGPAAMLLRRRIGGPVNLKSYAESLVAAEKIGGGGGA